MGAATGMITAHVWKALQRPPRTHRLFQLASVDVPAPRRLPISNSLLGLLLALLAGAIFLSREFSSMLSLLIFFAIPLVVANVIFIAPLYGLRWALRSSRLIARLRRSGAYELLCLMPPGPLNVNWMLCTATLYKSIGTAALEARALWPTRMFLIVPLVVFLTIQSGMLDQPGLNVLIMGLYLALFVLWFRLEDMQSLTLGGLLGMLVPTFTHDYLQVRISAITGFLAVQFISYVAAFILFQAALPALYAALNFNTWLADLSRPALALTLLWALREGMLWAFWSHLLDRLQAGPEVRLMLGHRV
jgi:hypothetical protein